MVARKIKTLKRYPIHHIKLSYDTTVLRIPGNKLKLGVSAVTIDGELYDTKGFLGGNIRWLDYKINANKDKVFAGSLRLTDNNKYLKDQYLEINATSRFNSDTRTKIRIPYNYETSVQISTDGYFIKSPGRTADLSIYTEFDNGSVKKSHQNTSGYLSFNNYDIVVFGGTIYRRRLRICSNIFLIHNHTVIVNASLKRNPEIKSSHQFLLDYKDNFIFRSKAGSGSSGYCGSNGSSGSTGGDGWSGQHGGSGSDGQRGHDLAVFADAYFDDIINTYLLKIFIENLNTGRKQCYYVNPNGGIVDVISLAGNGGRGGSGGSGGSGGNGRDGSSYTVRKQINDSTYVDEIRYNPGEGGGDGGSGGHGGDGGDGGDGGFIDIHLTEAAKEFSHVIRAYTYGGAGGSRGWGGSGGSGGRGGSGDPSGSSGSSGCSGSSGSSGRAGRNGKIYYSSLSSFDFW